MQSRNDERREDRSGGWYRCRSRRGLVGGSIGRQRVGAHLDIEVLLSVRCVGLASGSVYVNLHATPSQRREGRLVLVGKGRQEQILPLLRAELLEIALQVVQEIIVQLDRAVDGERHLRIDISAWESGVYFVKSGDSVVKIIKQ